MNRKSFEILTKIGCHTFGQILCCLLSKRHASPHQAVPTPVRWGMVIHSSHMQIVPVRLGRPWERIKASGLGSHSISPSSLPTMPPPPPLYHPLPTPSSCCSSLCTPPPTHLPLLPRVDLVSGVCWLLSEEVEGRLS